MKEKAKMETLEERIIKEISRAKLSITEAERTNSKTRLNYLKIKVTVLESLMDKTYQAL
jgi:hypothetical protein